MVDQLLASLRQRYLLGTYQVTGTFEHQHSLSMFVTLIGMEFLAVSLGPKTRASNLYLVVFLACAFIVESTLSRGGYRDLCGGQFGGGAPEPGRQVHLASRGHADGVGRGWVGRVDVEHRHHPVAL
jgi:hypothetical protein